MRAYPIFYLTLAIICGCTFLNAADPDYDAELQRVMKMYPPGDYDGMPIMRSTAIITVEKPVEPPTLGLLEPVERPDKSIESLLSEAAQFFTTDRVDLAMKRYKQILLLDPENKDAKARLYDIVVIRTMWHDEAHRSEASKKESEASEQLFKEITPQKTQE
jgi:hypothetical protein